ncbi:MAG TPA: hypothetical protein VHJ76_06280 [Actinomycetota bacterium]|nr:hypothetical protein [Actinomycetota bacterium]
MEAVESEGGVFQVRLNERSLVVWIGGGLVAAIAIAVVAFLLLGGDDDAGDAAAAPGGNAAASLEGGPNEVLYLSGTTLIRRNLETQREEPAGTVPTPSVYASPASHWIAYVTSKVSAEADFAAAPVLTLHDLSTDEKEKHGAGVAPVWNPRGTHVAFLRPVQPRECQGETCSGEVQIGVVEAATGEESLLLDPGRYSILGWAGEHILVSDFIDPSRTIVVSLDGEAGELGMPAGQYWDASPDGRWVVKANAKKTEFISIEGGELGDERVTVELGDYRLLEGAWAHDSSRVAAVVSVDEGKGKRERLVPQKESTRVVTFSPEDPRPQTVEGTFGATGTILWSVDNEGVVFASLLDPRRALFQATYCALGNESSCEIVTSWTEGVALLRTE